jgi:hypothetical protein
MLSCLLSLNPPTMIHRHSISLASVELYYGELPGPGASQPTTHHACKTLSYSSPVVRLPSSFHEVLSRTGTYHHISNHGPRRTCQISCSYRGCIHPHVALVISWYQQFLWVLSTDTCTQSGISVHRRRRPRTRSWRAGSLQRYRAPTVSRYILVYQAKCGRDAAASEAGHIQVSSIVFGMH